MLQKTFEKFFAFSWIGVSIYELVDSSVFATADSLQRENCKKIYTVLQSFLGELFVIENGTFSYNDLCFNHGSKCLNYNVIKLRLMTSLSHLQQKMHSVFT